MFYLILISWCITLFFICLFMFIRCYRATCCDLSIIYNGNVFPCKNVSQLKGYIDTVDRLTPGDIVTLRITDYSCSVEIDFDSSSVSESVVI